MGKILSAFWGVVKQAHVRSNAEMDNVPEHSDNKLRRLGM